MREIKFRAWNKKTEKMIDCASTTPLALHPDLIDANTKGLFIPFHEDLILMQSTGLQDKSGKPIFEGDIVKVDRQDSFSHYNKAIIIYAENHGAFLLQYTKPVNPKGVLSRESITSNDGTILFGSTTGWDIEIIGNIHENPELLE